MLDCELLKYKNENIGDIDVAKYKTINESIIRDFLDGDLSQWLNINTYISTPELEQIKSVSQYIRNNCDVFIVIGIGGSYMGSKAIIEALTPTFNKHNPEIIFFGKNLNPDEYFDLLEYIKGKEVIVNVVSKSGTTLEPSLAFDLMLKIMEEKYDDLALKKRIIVTTDKENGTLRQMVNDRGFTSFVVPSNVGGRYSVFTPVGLLPIAVANIDIDKLLLGAKNAMESHLNEAVLYATVRDIMYNNNKLVESYTIYDEKLTYFAEWLKQLFAETQGKDGKGILPISNINTRDLHSMGQYLQDGSPIIFETVIGVKNNKLLPIDKYQKDLNTINNLALVKVCEAHANGHTPSSIIWMEKLDEENLGAIMQFFMMSAIVGAKQLGVNPFDQPGVQEYKRLINEALDAKNN